MVITTVLIPLETYACTCTLYMYLLCRVPICCCFESSARLQKQRSKKEKFVLSSNCFVLPWQPTISCSVCGQSLVPCVNGLCYELSETRIASHVKLMSQVHIQRTHNYMYILYTVATHTGIPVDWNSSVSSYSVQYIHVVMSTLYVYLWH